MKSPTYRLHARPASPAAIACSNCSTSQASAPAAMRTACRSASSSGGQVASGGSSRLRSCDRAWRSRERPACGGASGHSRSISSSRGCARCGAMARRASRQATARVGQRSTVRCDETACTRPSNCTCQWAAAAPGAAGGTAAGGAVGRSVEIGGTAGRGSAAWAGRPDRSRSGAASSDGQADSRNRPRARRRPHAGAVHGASPVAGGPHAAAPAGDAPGPAFGARETGPRGRLPRSPRPGGRRRCAPAAPAQPPSACITRAAISSTLPTPLTRA